ncbi:Nucleolar protein 12 [Didymosphaeria variabile]|uniref:Nucleolar protein 12 n=1 Tax=Didymosphaeria variabile TaxID=1932322 RepID=A0A9W9C5E6_9PLEO|nr:Nucleolar protein 12 [Didymosphaeria variabile]KAJ4345360.1 Nucleolar protein 12 [Didymosphaeria variabile]
MGGPKKSSGALAAADQKSFDPSLTSLFASSLGPVKLPPKSRYQELVKQHTAEEHSEEEDDNDATLSSISEDIDDADDDADAASNDSDEAANASSDEGENDSENEAVLSQIQESAVNGAQERSNKKRKRGAKDEDVEDVYMQKIAREEAKEEEERKKKRKTKTADVEDEEGGVAAESDEEPLTIPKHETLAGADGNSDEVEKAARTVFLGNVSSEAITSKSAEKQLKQHLSSFIADLADNKPPHKVESIRFRSTAFVGALPKRAAFAKKEIMDSTTKSTNAYVVYTTKTAAREAAKRLNGTVILGRHLRVDSIAHPAKVDHRRCVFVGNLGFVDDESKLPTEGDTEKKRKNKPPGDVEEGLWTQFSKAGKVESVRVPRDAKTRVSKGFAYVQFEDENAVEAALQFNDQKYPPLLPRKLRVSRARAEKKKKERKPAGPGPSKADEAKPKGAYNVKISAEEKSQRGRAGAMLSKAAKFKTAESFVFEGHRASSQQGTSVLKLGGKTKKGPNGRKSRSKAWKAGGGKK